MSEKTLDINLHAKLVETVAPMLTNKAGMNAGLVGRATLKKATAIVDSVIARINGEGCKIVKASHE